MNYRQLHQDNTNLRPHQIEAKRKIFDAWDKYASVMLQMPTGTGKTYLFTSLINDLLNAYKSQHEEINILIVAHRTELLDQISMTLDRYGIAHGFIQGTREQHLWKRVQVGSIMSLLTSKNYSNVVRQKFDYIIVDEAHHSLADTYMELFGLFPEAKKLGVTATPCRMNHESFLQLYDILITSPQISWFINNRLLADFDYVSIKPDSEIQKLVDRSEVSQMGDFVNADLDNTFNNMRIRSKLYESYERYAKGRKGIIYAINKAHAIKIAELYSSHGVKAVAIDCDTQKEERQDCIEAFKCGDIKILVNVDIFTEGFDCPDVSLIQLARPTRSLALYLQQVGRGLRIVEGKEKTIIIDNVGLYNYFGLPDANRKWQYWFKGREDVEHEAHKSQDRDYAMVSDYEFDESRFNEENEEMAVIRGAKDNQPRQVKNGNLPKTTKPEISEFSLCDYYLIRGHRGSFKVYPFIKKRGKTTDSVGNCVFEYNESQKGIEFGEDAEQNRQILDGNVKLQSILSFVAMLSGHNTMDFIDLARLGKLADAEAIHKITPFELLEAISRISKKQ